MLYSSPIKNEINFFLGGLKLRQGGLKLRPYTVSKKLRMLGQKRAPVEEIKSFAT